jgi:hypothetical protein
MEKVDVIVLIVIVWGGFAPYKKLIKKKNTLKCPYNPLHGST